METHFTYKLVDLGNLEFQGLPCCIQATRSSIRRPAMHNAAIAKLLQLSF